MVTHGMLDSLPFYREDGDCGRPESLLSSLFLLPELAPPEQFLRVACREQAWPTQTDENRLFASLWLLPGFS